jgi:hypothetical protein
MHSVLHTVESLESNTADASHSSTDKAKIPIVKSKPTSGLVRAKNEFRVRSDQCAKDTSQRRKETKSNIGLHRPSSRQVNHA